MRTAICRASKGSTSCRRSKQRLLPLPGLLCGEPNRLVLRERHEHKKLHDVIHAHQAWRNSAGSWQAAHPASPQNVSMSTH